MVIEVLFPDICNLHGDLANIRYLKNCLVESNTDVRIVETNLTCEPYFVHDMPDMIFIGTMSEKSQEIVIDKLKPYRERLIEIIQAGKIVYASGNAMEIFGEKIGNEDGTNIKCLEFFNTFATKKMYNRFNSLYLGSFLVNTREDKKEDIEVVGFKSQFTHSYCEGQFQFIADGEAANALFETIRGPGLNSDAKGEGIRYKNFMATYVLGPFMILNPLFTIEIMKLMGVKEPKLAYEVAAMESYNVRLTEFKEPNRGYYY